ALSQARTLRLREHASEAPATGAGAGDWRLEAHRRLLVALRSSLRMTTRGIALTSVLLALACTDLREAEVGASGDGGSELEPPVTGDAGVDGAPDDDGGPPPPADFSCGGDTWAAPSKTNA